MPTAIVPSMTPEAKAIVLISFKSKICFSIVLYKLVSPGLRAFNAAITP